MNQQEDSTTIATYQIGYLIFLDNYQSVNVDSVTQYGVPILTVTIEAAPINCSPPQGDAKKSTPAQAFDFSCDFTTGDTEQPCLTYTVGSNSQLTKAQIDADGRYDWFTKQKLVKEWRQGDAPIQIDGTQGCSIANTAYVSCTVTDRPGADLSEKLQFSNNNNGQ